MKHFLAFILLASIFTGCASYGRKLDSAKVDQIKKGETTREQVIKLIGSPDQITKDGNGNVTFLYSYVKATAKGANFVPVVNLFAGGVNMQNQSVMVTFGDDGVCKDILSTQGGNELNSGLSTGADAKLPETKEGKRPK